MGSLEKRCAEAFLSLSENTKQADQIGSALDALGRLFIKNPEFRSFILNPVITRAIRGEILLGVLIKLGYINVEENGAAPEAQSYSGPWADSGVLLLRFLQMLLEKGRLAFLPNIAEEYINIKNEHRKIIHIIARSSEPLDAGALDELRDKYMAQYGSEAAEITNIVVPSLIGGISVQIGDMHIDDTLYGRLAALARTIAAGAVKQTAEAG